MKKEKYKKWGKPINSHENSWLTNKKQVAYLEFRHWITGFTFFSIDFFENF